MKISAVIAVSEEETEKLKGCLESLGGFCDEVILFALGFELKGVDAKITRTERPKYIEVLRNEMVASANGGWVLILDPDERLTQTLKEKLKEVVAEKQFSVVNIPRKNIFFGKWIAHTSWWPDRQLRFFRKGALVWGNTIHKYPKVRGKVLELPAREELAIEHYGYDSFSEFVLRNNRYSKIEAENLNSNGVRFSIVKMIWQAKREFLRRYIRHQGYRDGFFGFSLSYLMAVYKIMVWVNLWRMQDK